MGASLLTGAGTAFAARNNQDPIPKTDSRTNPTTGDLTRNVSGPTGSFDAVTGKTGGVLLTLMNLHDDATVYLPLDTAVTPTVLDYDEYGVARVGQSAARYGWLGGAVRATDDPTGALLMGVRVYEPGSGRFLQTDPVPGGSASAYDYVGADPSNATDTAGTYSKGSSSFNFFSPVWWFTVHLNRNETSWLAWASGTIFNALWYAGGKWKWVARILGRVLTILEIYLFYISATAAYASARGNCVAIQVSGAKWPWSNGIKFVVPPYLWSERCRG
ncbi:RHS repeat-associated core domain-containing protein [Embleya sp. MST-111070]